ncbi:MAG: PTS fructose transporter subunit IIA [Desulfosarcinaceae bacterium]|nr:PTS fructose transporter subunit IIA [Desulfosarcinaceae bacterium]
MIGILIVTHPKLGEALIDTAEFILGSRPEAVKALSIDINENAEDLRRKITAGLNALDANQGVLIMTDMFGGTPSNLSYSLLEEGRIEVISGANLPLLIRAVNYREKKPLVELVQDLEVFGKKSISLASGLLKGNKRG